MKTDITISRVLLGIVVFAIASGNVHGQMCEEIPKSPILPGEVRLAPDEAIMIPVRLSAAACAGGENVNLSMSPGIYAFVPGFIVVPEGETSAEIMVTAIAEGEETLTAINNWDTTSSHVTVTATPRDEKVFSDGFEGDPLPPILVINEVDYDQDGSDTAEFVEILNTGTNRSSLGGVDLLLVNGSGNTVYATYPLDSVTLEPGEYHVICDRAVNVPNCDQELALDTFWIQNGSPDGVALQFGNEIIDALSYEGSLAPPYTEGTGTVVGDTGSLGLSRSPDGTDTDDNSVDFSLRCITPGASNTLRETDCEALTPDVGQLVITELLANPSAVSDTNGEWFEVLNPGIGALNLNGCQIDDSSMTTPHVIAIDLVIAAGSLALFAKNADSNINGGLPQVDHVYAGNFLNNTGDGLTISCNAKVIDSMSYVTATAGVSLQLDVNSQTAGSNDIADNWCASISSYGSGDLGTPGGVNFECQ